MKTPIKLIAIGASAGGVVAVKNLLTSLSRKVKTPIVVVQHIPKEANVDVRIVYGNCTHYGIFEVEDKMPIEEGKIYFCPPAYHVLVEKDQTLALSVEDPVHYCRPSIDVFFESAARVYKSELLGVLLTGANSDGAQGLSAVKDLGGFTIVQNPDSAEVRIMPEAALKIFTPQYVLHLEDISLCISALALGGIDE